MQGNVPKFEFCNVFENAEIVKTNSLFFSFTESPEKKKTSVFQKVKIRGSSCWHRKTVLKDISGGKLLRCGEESVFSPVWYIVP